MTVNVNHINIHISFYFLFRIQRNLCRTCNKNQDEACEKQVQGDDDRKLS